MALSFKPLSLQDVKEAYLCGAEDYAQTSKPVNPWHKASEELPKEKHYKENTLQGIREWTESDIVLVIDNHYLKTVDSLKNGEWMKLRTHPKDCDGFPIEYLYWMEIPKIKED